MKNQYYVLSNGIKIPKIGFGTWQIPNGEICFNSVQTALINSYLHIDTASAYGNEESVGKAVRGSSLSRDKIFITSKVPAEIKSYPEAKAIIEKSLKLLNLEYIDLLLIHNARPWSDRGSKKTYNEENIQVWKAMEEAYDAGLVKSIGVSNFQISDLENLMANSKTIPVVNQIRYFIGYTQESLVAFCKANNILVEAYSPLATGRLLDNPLVLEIARKYNKTLPQIAIRFCLENDVLPLPKSVHEEYIKANFDVNFKISKEDMNYLNSLKDILIK